MLNPVTEPWKEFLQDLTAPVLPSSPHRTDCGGLRLEVEWARQVCKGLEPEQLGKEP